MKKRCLGEAMTFETKYDWNKIEQSFVQGIQDDNGNISYPEYNDLIDLFGCTYSTLTSRASKGKWKQKREAYQKKLKEQIEDNKVSLVAYAATEFDASALESAAKIMKCTEEKLQEKMNTSKDHLNYVKSWKTAFEVGKTSLGEPAKIEETKTTGKVMHEHDVKKTMQDAEDFFNDQANQEQDRIKKQKEEDANSQVDTNTEGTDNINNPE